MPAGDSMPLKGVAMSVTETKAEYLARRDDARREYKFEIGETVYAIGGDFDAVFVGKVIKRGFIDGNVNVYAVSSPKYKDELFLENGLISADTAYAMIAG
jgi:hypothetical protein